MDGTRANLSDLASRLKAEFRRDKKRATVLVVLLVVAGIVGGRLVVKHAFPSDAAAASRGGTKDLLPAPTHTGTSGLAGENTFAGGTGRERLPAVINREITRDLFQPDSEYFPLAEGADSRVTLAPEQQTGLFQQVCQWIQAKHSAQSERLERINVIRVRAQGLSLQSTMLGQSPTAVINGQVLRKGDWISGFCLKTIGPNSCVISREGVDVELHMKQ